jgi:hypothetical protein
MGRAEIRALIRAVRASMRTRRPSNWVAHPSRRRRRDPTRRLAGGSGVPTGRLALGSMRETVHGRAGAHGMGPRLRTQTDPSPTATLKGCGTGIWIPTGGGPLGVVAGGWLVQPAVAAARSTATASQRRPRGQQLPGSRCPRSTRLRRTSAAQHGGGSIASPRCEDGSPVTPPAPARFQFRRRPGAQSRQQSHKAIKVAPQRRSTALLHCGVRPGAGPVKGSSVVQAAALPCPAPTSAPGSKQLRPPGELGKLHRHE